MKSALITGANRGIGLATAKELLKSGFKAYLGSRSLTKGLQVVGQLKGEGFHHAEAMELDVTDEGTVRNAVKAIARRTDHLGVLINNAGVNGGAPPTQRWLRARNNLGKPSIRMLSVRRG